MKIEDLSRLYSEAESVDSGVFSEQRSNVLLVSGDHYNRRNSRFWSRLRDNKDLTEQQRIRLTKNHIQKITKMYVNNILTYAPFVKVLPKSETELQDVKSAELHNAVLADLKQRHSLRDKIRQWAKDYIDIGECFVKIFFDPAKGSLIGFEQETDEAGNSVIDEMGQPVSSKNPVMTGDVVFERVFAFNILREPSSKDMSESKYLIVRKMVGRKEMEARLKDDQEKLQLLEDGRDETYLVFDGNSQYSDKAGQMLLKEFYFRPCAEYPKGYFYICTNKGILWEGELPFGIFPIHYVGFDDMQTSARCSSIVKVCRPYQSEVNRTGSMIAEAQLTLGHDKVLIQSGTKIANGGFLPGVRAVQYSGAPPTILPGRAGDQYLAYMNSQIDEMYKAANVFEDMEEKGDQDPLLSLFKSLRQKKKFVTYAEKFEDFLVRVFETALDIAKNYYTEDMLIPAIGKREYINIEEFKNTEKLCYQIKVEPLVDDIDTLMGKQLTFQHVIQYAGGQLTPEQLGNMIRNMPYANGEQAFEDMTLDYDNVKNDILSLDRGVYVPANKYDTHPYVIKKLINRMKMSDFKMLPPQIQQMYQAKVSEHEQTQAQIAQELKQAESEFIPSGGYSVVCDLYVPDKTNPGKTNRVKVPSESLSWLLDKLEQQGSSQEAIASIGQGAQGDIANMVVGQNQQGPSPQDQALMSMLQGQGGVTH